jgi:hypothetical protein
LDLCLQLKSAEKSLCGYEVQSTAEEFFIFDRRVSFLSNFSCFPNPGNAVVARFAAAAAFERVKLPFFDQMRGRMGKLTLGASHCWKI